MGDVPAIPVGMIMPFAGDVSKIPSGWLLCDGSQVSRSTYASLFDVISTNWGRGDNATTFHLPDLRGRFLRGVDGGSQRDPDWNLRTASNEGGNIGEKVGSVQEDELKSHSHNYADSRNAGDTSADNSDERAATIHEDDIGRTTAPFGGNETRPKNAYVYYIIKH